MMHLIPVMVGSRTYQMEVVSTQEDIGKGMSKYQQPPTHPMLFILACKYTNLTMDDVRFPLDIIFYDKQWNPLPIDGRYPYIHWLRMYPQSRDRPIPLHAYYMVEFPMAVSPVKIENTP